MLYFYVLVAQNIFMKTLKVFIGILSIGFAGTFFLLSNYFFDYFYYYPSVKAGEVFYVSLVFLVLAIIFNILFFILVLRDKKLITKLYCAILPITIVFALGLYYLTTNNYSSRLIRGVTRAFADANIGGNNINIAYILIAIYIVALFGIIAFIVKPIKEVQIAVKSLSSGYTDKEFKIGKGREFDQIEKGLNQINNNYKQSRVMFDRLNSEYSKYLPQQFVKELGKKSVLELSLGCNIQKKITSVFIDIRNSTKTSYTLSLTDNFNFINKYLGIIGPIVRKNNGFVDKYLGDGVLAIFIKPEEAINACNEITKAINQDSHKLGIYSTKVGIGVHTGEVVMGVIGDKKRLSATVISDSVNAAAYLEKINRKIGSSMLFSKETLNSLGKKFEINYRYAGTFELAKDNTITVFECLDCYEEKKKNNLILTKDEFENAVRCYELGGDNCKKGFEKSIEKEKSDSVAKYYLGLKTKK